MSDQYYENERTPAEDPQEELTALSTQLASMPAWEQTAQPLMQEAEQYLGQIYNNAEQAGDGETMAMASAAWERTQAVATEGARSHRLAQAFAAVAKKGLEKSQQAVKELAELTHAVQYMDTDNPLVQDLVEAANEDAVYWNEWGADMSFDELAENIVMMEEMSHDDAHTIISLLYGNEPEIKELDSLINAFTAMRQRIAHEQEVEAAAS